MFRARGFFPWRSIFGRGFEKLGPRDPGPNAGRGVLPVIQAYSNSSVYLACCTVLGQTYRDLMDTSGENSYSSCLNTAGRKSGGIYFDHGPKPLARKLRLRAFKRRKTHQKLIYIEKVTDHFGRELFQTVTKINSALFPPCNIKA